MRIGLFIDTFNIGGAETMLLDIAALLLEHQHEPVLLHFGNSWLEEFAQKHQLEQHTLPHHKLYKKTLTLPLFALKMAPVLKSLQLDCLHTHLFGSITGMAAPARIAGLRHVGTLHDVYTIEEAPKRAYLLKLAAFLKTHLIAVSSPMYDFYRKTCGLSPQDLELIPNFVPSNNYINERQQQRSLLGLDDSTLAIVSVGRLVALKRFDLVIQAAQELVRQGHNMRVFIVGGGELERELQQQIEMHKLQKIVTLLGERKDVANLLAAADIFVLASDTEGMSRSILEAMATGLPVVATDVGGNCDLVEPEKNGLLVPANDAQALAAALAGLLVDENKRRVMGTTSLQKAQGNFGADSFYARHMRAYGAPAQ